MALAIIPCSQGCTVVRIPCTPLAKFQKMLFLFLSFVFSSTKMQQKSKSRYKTESFAWKRQLWSYPKRHDKVILEKSCFTLYFFSDKLNHYKTYAFTKVLISDTFKNDRWQNIFNRYEIIQISPPRLDYAWFLGKPMKYQNIIQLCNVYIE